MKYKKKDYHSETNIDDHYLLNNKTFESLFENYPDAVFTLDRNGHLLNYNSSVKRIFGCDDNDLKRDFRKYLFKDNQVQRTNRLQKALNGEAQKFTSVVRLKNGELLHAEVSYTPIFSGDKQVLGIYGIARDITKDVENEKAILKIKSNLELAQQVAKIGSWEYDIIEDESFWSNQTYQIYGIDEASGYVPTYNKVLKRIHPDDQEYFDFIFTNSIKNCESYNMEFRISRVDGSTIHVYEQAEVILDENKQPIRIIGFIQDITKRKMVENKLSESEQRFKNIYTNLEAGIWSFDVSRNEFILISPGVEVVTGYTSDQFKHDIAWESIIHGDDLPKYRKLQPILQNGESLNHQYRIIHKCGEIRWVQDQTIPVLDDNGNLIRIDGIITNITELKVYEERITHFAYHDILTNLPNKRMFDDLIQSLVKSKDPINFTLLYLNLDRLGNINDTLGYEIGDKLLQEFTKRINTLLDDTSLIARLDGDEFSIILYDFKEKEYPVAIAREIIKLLKEPFYVDDYELYISSSIGISNFPHDGESKEELLKNARAALNRAKEMGKNNYQIYSASLNISSFKLYTLERDLHKAIQNEELYLDFQPRVDTATGKMVSAEALVRWEHPIWGQVSPGEFIPLAEESELILDIGDWVLEKVCSYLQKWSENKSPIVPISINVSAKRFLRNDLISKMKYVLEKTNTDPKFIELEITETTLVYNEETVSQVIQSLREMGIRIALDDFGTGFSSLTYLKNYPIDTIKIDQSFIQNINIAKSDEMIIKSIIFLAKGLDLNVVAEGVETNDQLTFLKQQECDEIQGYLFSKPVDEKRFEQLLKNKVLKVNNSLQNQENIENRRKYYRINLLFPLSSNMSLTSINGKSVELGKTEVLIEDIGIGGLRFLSNINLPVRPDVILEFETLIMEHIVKLQGHIVWKQEVNDLYQYGLQFTINEVERDKLVKLLNNFQIQLRKNPLVQDCHFIQEDKMNYLKIKK